MLRFNKPLPGGFSVTSNKWYVTLPLMCVYAVYAMIYFCVWLMWALCALGVKLAYYFYKAIVVGTYRLVRKAKE